MLAMTDDRSICANTSSTRPATRTASKCPSFMSEGNDCRRAGRLRLSGADSVAAERHVRTSRSSASASTCPSSPTCMWRSRGLSGKHT